MAKTIEDLEDCAQGMISREDGFALEVAVEHAQQFGNVKHTTWFRTAIMAALVNERPRQWGHLEQQVNNL